MLEKKGLSDTRIAQITGISLRTITQWKTQKDTYRYKLYRLLKTMDESELIKAFSQLHFFVFTCFFYFATRFLRGLFYLFFCLPLSFCPVLFLSHTNSILLLPPARHTRFLRVFISHARHPPTFQRHISTPSQIRATFQREAFLAFFCFLSF